MYLKQLSKILFITLFFAQPCFAQSSDCNFMEAWKDLRSVLQRRADIVPNLAITLSNSKHVDQKELKRAKGIATYLYQILDTLHIPDSASLFLTSQLEIELTEALTRTLVTLERDRNLKNTSVIRELLTSLEEVEHRFERAKLNYNNACTKAHRADLLFKTSVKY
jgi:hypothetical protein